MAKYFIPKKGALLSLKIGSSKQGRNNVYNVTILLNINKKTAFQVLIEGYASSQSDNRIIQSIKELLGNMQGLMGLIEQTDFSDSLKNKDLIDLDFKILELIKEELKTKEPISISISLVSKS